MNPDLPTSPAPALRTAWLLLLGGGVLAAASVATLDGLAVADVVCAALAAAVLTAGALFALRRPAPAQGGATPAPDTAQPPLAYPLLMDALPDPMMTVSAREPDDFTSRRIQFANAAARELLRIAGDQGLLVTAIRDPGVLEAADEALFGGVSAEATLELGGGLQPRMFRVIARPLPATDDDSRLALLVFREETELRRAERTRADFLANASHELRTPLASLSGFIETLRGHARDDPAARNRFLEIMQAQTQRMARLVDDLMSLSRIELNERQPPSERVDLAGAALDVVDALAPVARDGGVRLETERLARGTVMVTGDRDQIIQVVQNLVDNAIKYSPSGGAVQVRAATGLGADAALGMAADAAGPRLALLAPDMGPETYGMLSVTDAGPGIAREHLPRLTERFYRVEGQKSGERLGTGLGLAIVKHIVSRHRGGLVVESAPGAGSVFTVYFPAATPQAVTSGTSIETESSRNCRAGAAMDRQVPAAGGADP